MLEQYIEQSLFLSLIFLEKTLLLVKENRKVSLSFFQPELLSQLKGVYPPIIKSSVPLIKINVGPLLSHN